MNIQWTLINKLICANLSITIYMNSKSNQYQSNDPQSLRLNSNQSKHTSQNSNLNHKQSKVFMEDVNDIKEYQSKSKTSKSTSHTQNHHSSGCEIIINHKHNQSQTQIQQPYISKEMQEKLNNILKTMKDKQLSIYLIDILEHMFAKEQKYRVKLSEMKKQTREYKYRRWQKIEIYGWSLSLLQSYQEEQKEIQIKKYYETTEQQIVDAYDDFNQLLYESGEFKTPMYNKEDMQSSIYSATTDPKDQQMSIKAQTETQIAQLNDFKYDLVEEFPRSQSAQVELSKSKSSVFIKKGLIGSGKDDFRCGKQQAIKRGDQYSQSESSSLNGLLIDNGEVILGCGLMLQGYERQHAQSSESGFGSTSLQNPLSSGQLGGSFHNFNSSSVSNNKFNPDSSSYQSMHSHQNSVSQQQKHQQHQPHIRIHKFNQSIVTLLNSQIKEVYFGQNKSQQQLIFNFLQNEHHPKSQQAFTTLSLTINKYCQQLDLNQDTLFCAHHFFYLFIQKHPQLITIPFIQNKEQQQERYFPSIQMKRTKQTELFFSQLLQYVMMGCIFVSSKYNQIYYPTLYEIMNTVNDTLSYVILNNIEAKIQSEMVLGQANFLQYDNENKWLGLFLTLLKQLISNNNQSIDQQKQQQQIDRNKINSLLSQELKDDSVQRICWFLLQIGMSNLQSYRYAASHKAVTVMGIYLRYWLNVSLQNKVIQFYFKLTNLQQRTYQQIENIYFLTIKQLQQTSNLATIKNKYFHHHFYNQS